MLTSLTAALSSSSSSFGAVVAVVSTGVDEFPQAVIEPISAIAAVKASTLLKFFIIFFSFFN